MKRSWTPVQGIAGSLWAARPDRWTVVEVLGAGLLGGGVWARWGASWACMLWGALLLLVAGVAAARNVSVERMED